MLYRTYIFSNYLFKRSTHSKSMRFWIQPICMYACVNYCVDINKSLNVILNHIIKSYLFTRLGLNRSKHMDSFYNTFITFLKFWLPGLSMEEQKPLRFY